MVTYNFTESLGKTLTFAAAADVLDFGSIDLTTLVIAESEGSVIIRNAAGQAVTLAATTLAQLSSKVTATTATANLAYTGGAGALVLGDDSVTSAADAGANTIDVSSAAGNHVIFGLRGADTITTGNSSDKVVVYGGSGQADTADGSDTITIGNGDSTVYANAGNDIVAIGVGDSKASSVFGGLGNDSIRTSSSSGTVTFAGNAGNDTIDLNASNFAGNFTIYGGNGLADSTDGNDNILSGTGGGLISANAGNDNIKLYTQKDVSVYGGLGNDTITDEASVAGNIFVSAGSGADSVTLNTLATGANVTVYGGNGMFDGTDGADLIVLETAGTVNATIYSTAGNDTITASVGTINATIFTGIGNDAVTTGAGADSITAGNGNNTINAGAGDNTIVAGNGNNTITVAAGVDSVVAGTGNNTINLGTGNDTLVTGNGNNSIGTFSGDVDFRLGSGNDTVGAAKGTDNNIAKNSFIDLGAGTDALVLDTVTGANNTIIGGLGNDAITITGMATAGSSATIWGGASATETAVETTNITISAASTTTVVDILGTAGVNTINVTGEGTAAAKFNITTGAAADVITTITSADSIDAGAGNNTLNTGTGADTIVAGNGNNNITTVDGVKSITVGNGTNTISSTGTGVKTVATGNGNNTITTGDAADVITTGSGTDDITAGADADTINAGAGNDILIGGTGADSLTGGAGSDIFRFAASSNGIDTITDFTTSASGDDFGLTLMTLGGANTVGELVNIANINAAGVGTNKVVVLTDDVVTALTASAIETALDLSDIDLTNIGARILILDAGTEVRGFMVTNTETTDNASVAVEQIFTLSNVADIAAGTFTVDNFQFV